MKALFCILLAISMTAGAESLVFRHGVWELKVDDKNGSWQTASYREEPFICNPEKRSSLWLKREDAGGQPVLTAHDWNSESGILKLRIQQGNWVFEEYLTFGERLKLEFQVTYNGAKPARFDQASVIFPVLKQGKFYLPGGLLGDTRSYYREITQMPDFKGIWQGELKTLPPNTILQGTEDIPFVLFEPKQGRTLVIMTDSRRQFLRASVKTGSADVYCDFYIRSCGWALPGKPQLLGPFELEVFDGSTEEALKAVPHRWYREIGMVPPVDREEWVLDASIWELDVNPSSCGVSGGLHEAADRLLPYIRKRGANIIWLQPIEEFSPYNPQDYYKIHRSNGTPEDYRYFVRKAHELGMRVWQDIVPHGGRPEYAALRGVSPFALSITRDGNVEANMAFDYSSPEWRNYITRLARYYMDNFGIDGFRIDQCAWSPPNWRLPEFPDAPPSRLSAVFWQDAVSKAGGIPAIEGERADDSERPGPLKLTGEIRRTVREVKGDGAILGEGGSFVQPVSDAVVDIPIRHAILKMHLFEPGEYARRLAQTLNDKLYTDPPDTRRLSLFEIHDNQFTASQILGEQAAKALRAAFFWFKGIPAVMDGRDIGQGIWIARLNQVRSTLPELRRGDIDFTAVGSCPSVFTVLRSQSGAGSICVTGFYPEAQTVRLEIPTERLGFPHGTRLTLWNTLSGEKLATCPLEEFRQFDLVLSPFGSAVLTWRPAGEPAPVPPPDVPSCKVPEARPLEVAETDDAITVRGSCELVIDRRSGLIRRYGELFEEADLLSDRIFPVAVPEIRVMPSPEKTVIEAKFSWGAMLSYTMTPTELKLEATMTSYSPTERTLLALAATKARRWQVYTFEGKLEDWIDPIWIDAGKTAELTLNSKLPFSSGILWQSFLKPLHPIFPKLKLFGEKPGGIEIEIDAPLSPEYDEIMALNRLNGKAGFHLALFWVQPGPLSTAGSGKPRRFAITLRPVGPEEAPAAAITRKGVTVRNDNLCWRIQNPHYQLILNRQGGVIREFRDRNGKVFFSGQDIVARKGLSPNLNLPRLSADMETFVRLYEEDDTLKFRFLGWLRNAANHGVAEPHAWGFSQYEFSAVPWVTAIWQLWLSNSPASESELCWSIRQENQEISRLFPLVSRQWHSFAFRLDSSGLHPLPATALPTPEFAARRLWNLCSDRKSRRFPCMLAPLLPGDDPQVYFSEFQPAQVDGVPAFQAELPMMWPHLTLPFSLKKPGKYRLKITLKTDNVHVSDEAGQPLRLQLLFRNADGKPIMLNRSFSIPSGTNGQRLLTAEFEVPPDVIDGNVKVLIYKLFGSGNISLSLPELEWVSP